MATELQKAFCKLASVVEDINELQRVISEVLPELEQDARLALDEVRKLMAKEE